MEIGRELQSPPDHSQQIKSETKVVLFKVNNSEEPFQPLTLTNVPKLVSFVRQHFDFQVEQIDVCFRNGITFTLTDQSLTIIRHGSAYLICKVDESKVEFREA